MRQVSLRIAFDVDGVLADLEASLRRRQAVLRQGGTVRQAGAALLRFSSPAPGGQRELWQQIRQVENFWHTLAECERGCVSRVAAAARDRRWEIIFLTRRPATAGDSAQRQTQWWLKHYGFDAPSVYVVKGSRGKIAAALDLDFVIDDAASQCLDVAGESMAQAILLSRHKTTRPPVGRVGIRVASSIDDCLAILCEADDERRRRPPGVLERVSGLWRSHQAPAKPRSR